MPVLLKRNGMLPTVLHYPRGTPAADHSPFALKLPKGKGSHFERTLRRSVSNNRRQVSQASQRHKMEREPSSAMRAAAAEAANLRATGAPRIVKHEMSVLYHKEQQPPLEASVQPAAQIAKDKAHNPYESLSGQARSQNVTAAVAPSPNTSGSGAVTVGPEETPRTAVESAAGTVTSAGYDASQNVDASRRSSNVIGAKRPAPSPELPPNATASGAATAHREKRPRAAFQPTANSTSSILPSARRVPPESSATPAPMSTAVQKPQGMLEKYGLLVVEHDAKGELEWVACKFCPAFGCMNRNAKYIKAFPAPFDEPELKDHLDNEHRDKWIEYRSATEQERTTFFDAKPMPAVSVFENRVLQLKQSWGHTRKERETRKRERREASERKKAQQGAEQELREQFRKSHKAVGGEKPGDLEERAQPSQARPPLPISTRERSAGRSCFAGAGRKDDPLEKGSMQRKPATPSMASKFQKLYLFPSHAPVHAEIPEMVTRGDLHDCHPREGLVDVPFCMPSRYLPPDWRGMMTRSGTEQVDRPFSAVVLFYLLRGIPLGVIATLLKEMEGVFLESEGNGNEENGDCPTGGQEASESEEKDCEGDHNGCTGVDSAKDRHNSEFASTRDDKDESDAVTGIVWDGQVFYDEHLVDKVWNCGNSVCAEGLRLLRKVLDGYSHTPFILLTTQPFPELGEGAVEVMISKWDRFEVLHWVHLVSVRPVVGAGDVVMRLLDCACSEWRARLVGMKSGLLERDAKERECEAAIFEALKKAEDVGSNLKYVPCSDGEENKELVPFCLPGITGVELARLINESKAGYLSTLETSPGTESKALVLQEKELQNQSGPVISASVGAAEALSKVGEVAPEAIELIEGLATVWGASVPYDGKSPSGCTRTGMLVSNGDESCVADATVDVEMERTLWARALVLLYAIDERPVNCRVGPPNRAYELTVASLWGANWSNHAKTVIPKS